MQPQKQLTFFADQVLQVDEGQPWDIKLSQLLEIGLRETMRRLETKLPRDECAPELRAAVFTQAGAMSMELTKNMSCLTPAATVTTLAGESSFPARLAIYLFLLFKSHHILQILQIDLCKWNKLN